MKKIDYKSFAAGLLLGAAAFAGIAASSTSRMPMEYRIVAGQILGDELERKLNRSASEGWELVETVSFSQQHGYCVMRRVRQ